MTGTEIRANSLRELGTTACSIRTHRIPCPVVCGWSPSGVFARQLPRHENAAPDRIWRHFLDATGTLHITTPA
jgi:hypothetical protein